MKPNQNNKTVILLTIDALRPDHLPSYGYKLPTAPNLKKFCKYGLKFTNAYTNGPETPSSFSTLFTSTLPYQDGGYSPLPNQKITFPEILSERKIFTYGIHGNPNLSRFYNYGRGFDIFLDGQRYKKSKKGEKPSLKHRLLSNIRKSFEFRDLLKKAMYTVKGINTVKNFIRNRFPGITDFLVPFSPMSYNASYLTNRIEKFLREKSNRPTFLWAHFMDVHSPYNPPMSNIKNLTEKEITLQDKDLINSKIYPNPKKYKITDEISQKLETLYDAQINFIDENLKSFFEMLKRTYDKNCLVVITADHGEALLDHYNTGHQGFIYNELLKIPLIFVELGNESKIKYFDKPVQMLDIAPTILDYFDIEPPDYFRGQSLLPLLKGKKIESSKLIISETYQKGGIVKRNNKEGYKIVSIIDGDFKYIYDEEKNHESLYNLKKDKGEKRNILSENEEIASRFRLLLSTHLEEVRKNNEKSKIRSAIHKIKI